MRANDYEGEIQEKISGPNDCNGRQRSREKSKF